MSTIETVSVQKSFGGVQGVYKHDSAVTGTEMTFAVYLPPQVENGPVPLLTYLSGLTCTHANVMEKGGVQAHCAVHGLALVMPDTSPRGLDLPGEHKDYDFGSGAGFYIDATNPPWDQNYKMYSYVTQELPEIMAANFPVDRGRQGIFGHSMGGHGALIIALKNPGIYNSVSAFAPIVAPMQVPWGQKVLSLYLGEDRTSWRAYDACALITHGAGFKEILVDQGMADDFLDTNLKPELLEAACAKAGIALTLNRRQGYDHSYYFISSFMGDHVAWHRARI